MIEASNGWVEPSRREIRRAQRLAARRAAALDRVERSILQQEAKRELAETHKKLKEEQRKLREARAAAKVEERELRKRMKSDRENAAMLSAALARASAERQAIDDVLSGKVTGEAFASYEALLSEVESAKQKLNGAKTETKNVKRQARLARRRDRLARKAVDILAEAEVDKAIAAAELPDDERVSSPSLPGQNRITTVETTTTSFDDSSTFEQPLSPKQVNIPSDGVSTDLSRTHLEPAPGIDVHPGNTAVGDDHISVSGAAEDAVTLHTDNRVSAISAGETAVSDTVATVDSPVEKSSARELGAFADSKNAETIEYTNTPSDAAQRNQQTENQFSTPPAASDQTRDHTGNEPERELPSNKAWEWSGEVDVHFADPEFVDPALLDPEAIEKSSSGIGYKAAMEASEPSDSTIGLFTAVTPLSINSVDLERDSVIAQDDIMSDPIVQDELREPSPRELRKRARAEQRAAERAERQVRKDRRRAEKEAAEQAREEAKESRRREKEAVREAARLEKQVEIDAKASAKAERDAKRHEEKQLAALEKQARRAARQRGRDDNKPYGDETGTGENTADSAGVPTERSAKEKRAEQRAAKKEGRLLAQQERKAATQQARSERLAEKARAWSEKQNSKEIARAAKQAMMPADQDTNDNSDSHLFDPDIFRSEAGVHTPSHESSSDDSSDVGISGMGMGSASVGENTDALAADEHSNAATEAELQRLTSERKAEEKRRRQETRRIKREMKLAAKHARSKGSNDETEADENEREGDATESEKRNERSTARSEIRAAKARAREERKEAQRLDKETRRAAQAEREAAASAAKKSAKLARMESRAAAKAEAQLRKEEAHLLKEQRKSEKLSAKEHRKRSSSSEGLDRQGPVSGRTSSRGWFGRKRDVGTLSTTAFTSHHDTEFSSATDEPTGVVQSHDPKFTRGEESSTNEPSVLEEVARDLSTTSSVAEDFFGGVLSVNRSDSDNASGSAVDAADIDGSKNVDDITPGIGGISDVPQMTPFEGVSGVDVTHTSLDTGDETDDFVSLDQDRDRKAARTKGRGSRRWLSWIVKKDDVEKSDENTTEIRRAEKEAAREDARNKKEAEKEAARVARQDEKDQKFEMRQLAKLERVRAKAEASKEKDAQKRADRDEREAAEARAQDIRHNAKLRQELEELERKEERQRNKADRRADEMDLDDTVMDLGVSGTEIVESKRGFFASLRERGESRRRLRSELLDARRDGNVRDGENPDLLTAEEKKLLRQQLKEERVRINEARKQREVNERDERRERREAEKADRRAESSAEKQAKGERDKLVRSFKNTRAEEKARKKEAELNAKAEAQRIKDMRKAENEQRRADEQAAKNAVRQEKKYREEVRRQQKKKAGQQRRLLREETKIARRARRIEMPEIAITRDEPALGPAYQWDAESGIYNGMAAGGEIDNVAYDLPEPLPRR
jgi:hypothetical protein